MAGALSAVDLRRAAALVTFLMIDDTASARAIILEAGAAGRFKQLDLAVMTVWVRVHPDVRRVMLDVEHCRTMALALATAEANGEPLPPTGWMIPRYLRPDAA